jgi:hypothetical protein
VLNAYDNCALVANAPAEPSDPQEDADGDGIGDACDDDSDGDGKVNMKVRHP